MAIQYDPHEKDALALNFNSMLRHLRKLGGSATAEEFAAQMGVNPRSPDFTKGLKHLERRRKIRRGFRIGKQVRVLIMSTNPEDYATNTLDFSEESAKITE